MSITIFDSGIHLSTYSEWKCIIGTFECGGKLIDSDTTVVLDKFDDETRLKIIKGKVVDITIWYCIIGIHCKCGEYHNIISTVSFEEQIRKLIQNAERDGFGTISGPKEVMTVEDGTPLIVYLPTVEEIDDFNPEYTYELSEENLF